MNNNLKFIVMKKLLLSVIACIIAASFIWCETAAAKPKRLENIKISIAKQPKPHIHRSPGTPVTAVYDYEALCLDVAFEDNFGTVVIQVQNSAFQTIAQYTCDTGVEQQAIVPCNLEAQGMYIIKISGQDLEAFGYLDVMN